MDHEWVDVFCILKNGGIFLEGSGSFPVWQTLNSLTRWTMNQQKNNNCEHLVSFYRSPNQSSLGLIQKWWSDFIVFVVLQGRWSISSISHKTLHQGRLLTSSSVSHSNQHDSVISLVFYFKASRRALQHWHASIQKKRVNLNFVPSWNWQFAPGLKPGLVQMSFPFGFWNFGLLPGANC